MGVRRRADVVVVKETGVWSRGSTLQGLGGPKVLWKCECLVVLAARADVCSTQACDGRRVIHPISPGPGCCIAVVWVELSGRVTVRASSFSSSDRVLLLQARCRHPGPRELLQFG